MSLVDQLTEDQIAEAREAFALNSIGSSMLSGDKISTTLFSLGVSPTPAEITQMLNGANEVEFPEFLDMVAKTITQHGDGSADILAAFRAYDIAGTGKIASNDLKHILCNLGAGMSAAEVDEWLASVGGSGDIAYEDLVNDMFTGF